MGYDIEIRQLDSKYKDLTAEEIYEKYIYYYDLDYISEKISHLYMSYNHHDMFKELDIYPRYFNFKRVKTILPKYNAALEKLKVDKDVYKEIVKIYEECEDYWEFQEKCKIDYFDKSKTVVYIIVSETIKTLNKCDENDFWFSD